MPIQVLCYFIYMMWISFMIIWMLIITIKSVQFTDGILPFALCYYVDVNWIMDPWRPYKCIFHLAWRGHDSYKDRIITTFIMIVKAIKLNPIKLYDSAS